MISANRLLPFTASDFDGVGSHCPSLPDCHLPPGCAHLGMLAGSLHHCDEAGWSKTARRTLIIRVGWPVLNKAILQKVRGKEWETAGTASIPVLRFGNTHYDALGCSGCLEAVRVADREVRCYCTRRPSNDHHSASFRRICAGFPYSGMAKSSVVE